MSTRFHPSGRKDGAGKGRRFAAARGGLDPAQVDLFLDEIAASIRDLEAQLRVAKQPDVDGTRADEARLRAERTERLEAMGGQEAEATLTTAKERAAAIRSEAAGEADRMRSEARAEAKRSAASARERRAKAEEEAAALRETADEQRELTLEHIAATQERLLALAHDLETAVATTNELPVAGPA